MVDKDRADAAAAAAAAVTASAAALSTDEILPATAAWQSFSV